MTSAGRPGRPAAGTEVARAERTIEEEEVCTSVPRGCARIVLSARAMQDPAGDNRKPEKPGTRRVRRAQRMPGAWRRGSFDPRQQRSYVRSNEVLTIPMEVTSLLLEAVCDLRSALHVGDEVGVARSSQKVVDGLCDGSGVHRIPVKVGGRRLVRGKVEYYGFCGRNGYMTLYCRTARRNLFVAFKTYLNTLVHEYMHHYDWHGLRIHSMHTAGFYQRVGDLYRRILGAVGDTKERGSGTSD